MDCGFTAPDTKALGAVINEGFTEGGDLTLRSLDGIDFNVYSVVLSLASPVLSDMFAVGSQRDVVTVGETAEVLALMLKFIYPRSTPAISSFDVLETGLHVAEKYQLEDMKNRLRKELSLNGSPVSLFSYPLRAMAMASAHGLKAEAQLAASVASKTHNFRTLDSLLKLANAIPSASPVIKLIGIPSAQMAILVDVLFNFHREPMRLSGGTCDIFLCSDCSDARCQLQYSPPEWQARWSHWAFEELKKRPFVECANVFTIGFFNFALYRDGTAMPTDPACECPSSINENIEEFHTWLIEVRAHLQKRLADLDKLESLT